MKKKRRIAVIVRNRQEEALRMALGIAILDDSIDIYILDNKLMETEKNLMNLEMIKAMGLKLFTNLKENGEINHLTSEEIAYKLLEYDHIITY
ncbi:MAG: hypothetical protein ACK415_00685 [Thermodesulfovibrionales bacterium]